MKNIWFLLMLMMGSLTIVSCGDDDEMGHSHDDDDYDVTIAINSPAADGMVTVDEAAHIEVEFTRPDNKIIHNVKIEVKDADGNVVATLVDDHAHTEGTYTYHENSFTPEMHGMYTLVASSTNDAGEHEVSEEVSFTAMHGGGDSEYKVTIDVMKPGDNEIATLDSPLPVEVSFTHETAGERIHNVMIDIMKDGAQVGVIFEMHVHSDVPYTYNEAAWTPTEAGTYTLRAMTTDFAGENMNMMMREFSVQ